MSNEEYARLGAREARIWVPFGYSFPFTDNQIADRITIFGLYANSYLNNQKYLAEIESDELANLLNDYNSRISELTTQEQIVVADIVSKRYLANVEKLIHDQKMITKQQEINADSVIMDAKIAALAADRAALLTMAAKVTTEITKNEARIAELQAYIQMESINLSLSEIEVVEKEIQLVKLDNEKLNIANEILRIQVETVETGMELIDIDLKIARTKVDISETDRAIAKIALLADDLTVEKARTSIEQAGIPISEARIELARAKYTDVDAEKSYIENTLVSQEAENLSNKVDLLNMKQTARLDELGRKEDLSLLANENERKLSDLSKTLATADKTAQEAVDAIKVEGISAKPPLAWARTYSAIRVAETLAAADITTTLTHTVQKKA